MGYAVVVPTVGRPNLSLLISALAEDGGAEPDEVIVVNDRPDAVLRFPVPAKLTGRLRIVAGPGRGPAAARNVGWLAATAPWVVFLDEDVVPGPDWRTDLMSDLASAGDAGGVAGRISVPLPVGRRPTDWERQVAGLANAAWATADMAYRRDVLLLVGGFDERFPRGLRADTDLALRVKRFGHALAYGRRQSTRPIGPAGAWSSLRHQRGNADDALLRRLYGPRWRELAEVPLGRWPSHLVTTASAAVALLALALRRRDVAVIAAAVWTSLTAELAARRIAPGPKTVGEMATMVVTSAAIPPLATAHWVRGWLAHRHVSAADDTIRPVPGDYPTPDPYL